MKNLYNNFSQKVFLFFCLIILSSITFACTKEENKNVGHFELIDGVDTFIKDDQIIKNQIVSDENGNIFFVDEEGHKKKDTWGIIDNDGSRGYFGSLGDLVKNKIREIDGKLYYFDEKGILYTDKTSEKILTVDGINYISNANGELTEVGKKSSTSNINETKPMQQTITYTPQQPQTIAQTIAQTTVQTAPIIPTSISTGIPPIYGSTEETTTTIKTETEESKIIESETTATEKRTPSENGPVAEENLVTGPGGSTITTNQTDTSNTNTVKITSTSKQSSSYEGNEYTCPITVIKPVISTNDSYETELINNCMSDAISQILEEVEVYLEETYDDDELPKSVVFSSINLGTVSASKIVINTEGTITLRKNGTRGIKYRITYYREEQAVEVTKI